VQVILRDPSPDRGFVKPARHELIDPNPAVLPRGNRGDTQIGGCVGS
jgi:hypothetical protein